MGLKISKQEPAERAFFIALSRAEVIVLANYHIKESKAVVRRYGQAFSAAIMHRPLSTREQASLSQVAERQMSAHTQRAKGLLSLVKA